MRGYDAIVIGVGGMGSAVLAHAARRGLRVIGIEQFAPAHRLGSSHGRTRMIRQAYWEDPAYVPLVLRAYELWRELERATDLALLFETGGLMVGTEHGALVAGSIRSARQHGLDFRVLDAGDIRRTYPAMRPRNDEVGVAEPNAGLLVPEECLIAHMRVAVGAGAELRFGVNAEHWETHGDRCSVTLGDGTLLESSHLVICAGAWLGALANDLNVPLRVERNVQHWFAGADRGAGLERLPVYIVQRDDVPYWFYGFPDLGDGNKFAFHYSGEYTTPQTLVRDVSAQEIANARAVLANWMPAAAGSHKRSVACMYTLTPDEHFIVDRLAKDSPVLVAGGFSGHGFKFCAAIGEMIADALQQPDWKPLPLFSLGRFNAK